MSLLRSAQAGQAKLPFEPKVVPTIATNQPWIDISCIYLAHTQLESQIKQLMLDMAEDRATVVEWLDEIRFNPLMNLREISDEVPKLGRVSRSRPLENNVVPDATQTLRARVKHLAYDILKDARNNSSVPLADPMNNLSHRIVVLALVCERLADLDHEGGYFYNQLNAKRKRAKTNTDDDSAAVDISAPGNAKQSKGNKRRRRLRAGEKHGIREGVEPVLESEELDTQFPDVQHNHSLDAQTSSLFVEQEDDGFHATGDAVPGSPFKDFYAIPNSILDTPAEDQSILSRMSRKRTASASSGGSLTMIGRHGTEGRRIENTERDQQDAPLGIQAPAPLQPVFRNLRSASMGAVCLFGMKDRYAELIDDFHHLSKTYKALERHVEKVEKRNADLTHLEFDVCQGGCDEELETANHRNWEHSNRIRALEAVVDERDSKIGELGNTVKQQSDEINRLEALVQELKLNQASN